MASCTDGDQGSQHVGNPPSAFYDTFAAKERQFRVGHRHSAGQASRQLREGIVGLAEDPHALRLAVVQPAARVLCILRIQRPPLAHVVLGNGTQHLGCTLQRGRVGVRHERASGRESAKRKTRTERCTMDWIDAATTFPNARDSPACCGNDFNAASRVAHMLRLIKSCFAYSLSRILQGLAERRFVWVWSYLKLDCYRSQYDEGDRDSYTRYSPLQ
jgi:hypothetical protein